MTRSLSGSQHGSRPAFGLLMAALASALLSGPLSGCAPRFAEDAALPDAPPATIRPAAAPVTDQLASAAASTDLLPPRGTLTADAIIAEDGRRLALRHWLPHDEAGNPVAPRATIVAVHGFNDYSNAFTMPGEALAAEGIATFAYDQRGFGLTPNRGRWPGERALIGDLATAARLVAERYPGVPHYLMGESMGGAVVLAAVAGATETADGVDALTGVERPHPDGIILVAPAVWGRRTMPFYQNLALWAGVRVAPGRTFTGEGLHILPSDNIPMLRALARDPLFIKATRIDAIWGLCNLMDDALDAAPQLSLPTLILYGAHDEVIPKGPIRRMIDELPGLATGQQRVAFYPDGYHMLLRDLEGPLVTHDVATWTLDPKAPLPSGADQHDATPILNAR
ncbi:MAG TPA: lysophospholipase [Stellaceae bacterium]|nr:lysophospholipase [Stellaceae bacterium]